MSRIPKLRTLGQAGLAALTGYGSHTVLLGSTLMARPGSHVLSQETVRASLTWLLSPWAGMGMGMAEAAQLRSCTTPQELLWRLPLMLIPHMLLAGLYATRRKELGLLALLLAAAWQAGRDKPALLWLPATLFTFTLLIIWQQRLFKPPTGDPA